MVSFDYDNSLDLMNILLFLVFFIIIIIVKFFSSITQLMVMHKQNYLL